MTRIAHAISSQSVPAGSIAIFWLGQAGYVIKTPAGQMIYIDAYLSYTCETSPRRDVMSKRLIPPPIEMSEITNGLVLATHMHGDHFDTETVQHLASHAREVHFGGPLSCIKICRELKIAEQRCHQLNVRDDPTSFDGYCVQAVFADHGQDEPEAIGIVVEAEGIRVYHTGDTSYCPEKMRQVINLKPDIIIPCINGGIGNMTGVEAARLAADVGAKVAIPSHYWMFIIQNTNPEGTPAAFLEACRNYAPDVRPQVLCIGEPFIYSRKM